jgi:hypothetical protein
MELQGVRNSGLPNNGVDASPSPHDERIDRCIRFYRSTFHLISIPLGIIFSIIHLKFAVEYLGQCTIQSMINIYMIVHASVALFLILLCLIGVINARCIYLDSEEDNNQRIAVCLILIIIILTLVLLSFSFAWLLAGSVWIFGAKSNGVQGSDPTAKTTYCQSDLYRAAFVLIIMNYVIHSLIILWFIFRCIFRKKST